MRSSARACVIIFFLLLLTTGLVLLSPLRLRGGQAVNEVPGPTIRVNTRLVLVDVVARDNKGKPVTDLKPDDFVVEENGKKEKIATFIPPPGESAGTPPPTLAPGLYTDRPDFRSPGGPPTVILLDAANTSFSDQAYGRLQMIKYVAEQSSRGQRIAIFTLTDTLNVLQDFTSDPRVLQVALAHYHPQEPLVGKAQPVAESAALGSPDLSPAMSASLAQATAAVADFQSVQLAYLQDLRVQETLQAMRALGRALGGIPGRKEVIWLTAAFPFDLLPENRDISEAEMAEVTQGRRQMTMATRAAGSMAEQTRTSYSDQIRQAAADLSSAQVAIYPIDVRGLASGMEGSASTSFARNPSGVSERAVATMSDLASSQETMRAIASETGGRAYVNQNEIKDGVALALADNEAAYTIGYYPENKKWDGSYRHIKVKAARDGIQLQSRKGYFAVDPIQEKNRKGGEQAVAETLRTNVPATLVTFSARAKTNEKGKLGIDFLVDAHTLSTEDASGGSKKFNFSYYAAIFSADGKMLSNHSMKVDQTFKPDTYQQILEHGIMLHLDMDAAPAPNQQLRLVVRDERTGFMGSTAGPLATQ